MPNHTKDDFYCAIHKCDKVWMMQNSFCPQCDTDKAMGFDVDFELVDFEKTEPFKKCSCKFPIASLDTPVICLKCLGSIP